MLDNYNRNIGYVRISVTNRCNLRCNYCMPKEGIQCIGHEDILTFEEIVNFISSVVPLGISKIRLTGGEPLVRKGIVDLVRMISEIPGITDLAMTTNGILLSEMAYDLYNAGLQRINISLDTLNPLKFSEITRGGDINKVFLGIKAAQKAGLFPIKINAVRFENNVEEEQKLRDFCRNENLHLRFIQQMNLKTGDFNIVEGGDGGNCAICNRIRLTANGLLKPCLFSDKEYSIRELGIDEAVRLTIKNKPLCASYNTINEFYNVGG